MIESFKNYLFSTYPNQDSFIDYVKAKWYLKFVPFLEQLQKEIKTNNIVITDEVIARIQESEDKEGNSNRIKALLRVQRLFYQYIKDNDKDNKIKEMMNYLSWYVDENFMGVRTITSQNYNKIRLHLQEKFSLSEVEARQLRNNYFVNDRQVLEYWFRHSQKLNKMAMEYEENMKKNNKKLDELFFKKLADKISKSPVNSEESFKGLYLFAYFQERIN